MPRIWTETIEEHREAVREATLSAAATLVAERGIRGVTMSSVAEEAGIGRATLYKYFSDLEEILAAWHERQIKTHLEEVSALCHADGTAIERLRAALERCALNQHGHQGSALAGQLHAGEHVARSKQHLAGLLSGLIAEAAATEEIRADVPAAELAEYSLHALGAARTLRSKAAVRRLVSVTLDALRSRRPCEPGVAA